MTNNKFYLSIPNNPRPIFLNEIPKEEYENFKLVSQKIYEFVYYKRRIKEIQLNKKVFFDIKNYYTEIYIDSFIRQIPYDYNEECFIEINSSFINFITSWKSFIEHCENKIEKMFGGKSSDQYKEFKDYLSYVYDNNFSYRLFYKLRNYAVHVGYPLDKVTCTTYSFDKFNEDCWYEVETLASKEDLSNSDIFSAKVREEIRNYEYPLDPSIYINQAYDLTLDIFIKFINIISSQFIPYANELIVLSEQYNQTNLSLTITKREGLKVNDYSIILPILLALEIKKISMNNN